MLSSSHGKHGDTFFCQQNYGKRSNSLKLKTIAWLFEKGTSVNYSVIRSVQGLLEISIAGAA